MSLEQVRIGILKVELGVPTENNVPSAVTITPTVCAITPADKLFNDINPELSTSDTYQFIIGFVGEDRTTGGYTVNHCSQGSGIASITAGQSLRLSVLNASMPSFYDEAVGMAVFIRTNSATRYQLHSIAYIDPDGDFNKLIMHKPLRSAPTFLASLLQSSTADDVLGDRDGFGFEFEEIRLTTNEMVELYSVTTVSVSPNNGPDFNIRTTVASGLQFESLGNAVKEFVRAVGGYYAEYAAVNGTDTIQESEMSIATAQAILRGNRPVRVTYPPDGQGNQEVAIYLGLLTFNQTELRAAWSKSATTPVTLNFETAILDRLLVGQHAKISYLKK
jgi:hypothetical protein